jgi:predicted dehydrogenase
MKAAILGAGAIARAHIKSLKRLEKVEIVAACDRLLPIAEAFADEHHIPRFYLDYARMLEETRPDVVHITTPAPSHFGLAMEALRAGCHVFVEKPATTSYEDFLELKAVAQARDRWLVEDHNYLFNEPVQRLLGLLESGAAGDLRHVDIRFCADLGGAGSPFTDASYPHPSLKEPGGAISDFLPHFAYLCNCFAGPHRSSWRRYGKKLSSPMPYDELVACVEGERASASIYFSASAQPNSFEIRMYGTRLTAEADLFEPRLSVWRKAEGPAGLQAVRNSISQAAGWIGSGLAGLRVRLSGDQPAMSGLDELIRRTYSALATGGQPPVTLDDVDACVRLTTELQKVCEASQCASS